MIGIRDLNDFYRGKIIQHLVARELISLHDDSSYKPHFWVWEEKDSSAEVNMVCQHGKYVIPIEVKSGKQGSLKSLHQFVHRSMHPYTVRFYQGEFACFQGRFFATMANCPFQEILIDVYYSDSISL